MTDSHEFFLRQAARVATQSLCLNSKCGCVIVEYGTIIARGYNAPPRDDIKHRRCGQTVPSVAKPKSDRTCCLHAEWRALLELECCDPSLSAATLYFVRVDDSGKILKSGRPYCTTCSRLALDAGIKSWVLWHHEGIREYDAEEYNDLSHKYDMFLEVPQLTIKEVNEIGRQSGLEFKKIVQKVEAEGELLNKLSEERSRNKS